MNDPAVPARRDWRSAVLPVVLVVAAIVCQATGARLPVLGRGWARLDPVLWPVDLRPELTAIQEAHPDGTRIFNDLKFGGFLIFCAPRLRVFIDDRCPLYGTELLTAYDRARRADPAQLDRWRRRYQFRYALVESGAPFDHHLAAAADWTLLQRTPAAVLYRYDAAGQ